jgi:hypothetical protein
MSDLNRNSVKIHSSFENQANSQLEPSTDMLAEELLRNINTTPIGKLLKQIAELPEIRQEKVSNVRSQLNRGEYDLNSRLEMALDKVLEELIS